MNENKDTEKTIDFEDYNVTGSSDRPDNRQTDPRQPGWKNYAYEEISPGINPDPGVPDQNPCPVSPDRNPETGTETPPDSQRLSWDYMPQDKESPPANPYFVFGLLGGIIAVLLVAIGILLGRTIGGSSGKTGTISRTREVSTRATEASTTGTTSSTTRTTENTPSSTTQAPGNTGPLTLSDDLADYTFCLNDVIYQLPCDYFVFTGNGWTISKYSDKTETDTVPGQKSIYFTMTNGKSSITVEAYNPGAAACALKECQISGVMVTGYNTSGFSIGKNITLLSSSEEVQNAFGPASRVYKDSQYESLSYYTDSDNYQESWTFNIYKSSDKSKSNNIHLRRLPLSRDAADENDKRISDEVPDYLSAYQAPASMNTTVIEPVFKLDGKLYRLPCPLSEFTGDGWEIQFVRRDSINGLNEEISVITIKKEDVTIRLSLYNYMEYPVKSEYCAVSGISLINTKADYTSPLPSGFIECPYGIKPEMSTAELKNAARSDLFRLYENSTDSYDSFSARYSESEDGVSVSYLWMDYKDGRYSRSIQIQSNKWDY